jgi:transcriptional regulator GlxA family with amidase domain
MDYQDEVADARLRAAKQLLATTDTPITNIALTVGFASLQHFSALFHKTREHVAERLSPASSRYSLTRDFDPCPSTT